MPTEEIVIDVKPDGSVRIAGEGFVGPECDRFMGQIEHAIGVVETRTNTPAYHRRAVAIRKAVK